jgi:hypothetical protein
MVIRKPVHIMLLLANIVTKDYVIKILIAAQQIILEIIRLNYVSIVKIYFIIACPANLKTFGDP